MARPILNTKGIPYFSHDSDMRNHKKLKLIKAKFGMTGYAFFNLLLEEIFSEGYALKIDNDFIDLFCDENNLEIALFHSMMHYSLEKNLFNKEIFDKYSLLTSRRCQENYTEATRKRKGDVIIPDIYSLIQPETIINDNINNKDLQNDIVNDGINEPIIENSVVNSVISGQSKVKESKVKESKVKEIEIKNFSISEMNEVLKQWNIFAHIHKLPKTLKLTEERKLNLNMRMNEPEFEISAILLKASMSKWLMKEKQPQMNFDFLINSNNNYIKILEGNYEKFKSDIQQTGRQGTPGYNNSTGKRAGQSKQLNRAGNKIEC